MSDLFPRWYASRMLLTVERSIYDRANAEEVSAVTGWPGRHQLVYYYPAYLLLLTVPLATLPYELAHIAWTAAGLWLLWAGMIVLARSFRRGLSTNRLTLLLVLVTLSVPVFRHTQYAQFNTIGLFALAASYRALSQQRYVWAGVWGSGLLFKPQATLVPLLVLLLWTAAGRERRPFWLGLGAASLCLWGAAELLEADWVISFVQSLRTYESTSSALGDLGDPHGGATLVLMLVTVWLAYHLRRRDAGSVALGGLLGWAIAVNALVVPVYGIMHMVLMGLSFVIVLSGAALRYPGQETRLWWGVIGSLTIGVLLFVVPPIILGPAGLDITLSDTYHRLALPGLLALLSLSLIFEPTAFAGWWRGPQRPTPTDLPEELPGLRAGIVELDLPAQASPTASVAATAEPS